MKEALYYQKHSDDSVRCSLCPHRCIISEGSAGICGVRRNTDGVLYTETYEQVSSIALDPIEKKPLNRFKPGTYILSVGTFGCNFSCKFCQNYHISKEKPETETLSASRLIEISNKQTDSIGIAFTYNEPTIWYEYILEAAKQNPKDTVLVTNGFIEAEPLNALLPYVDAMNIDLKSMNDDFYRQVCGGQLTPVQETIKAACQKTHVELTFLAIPGYNDSDDETKMLAEWVASVDTEIPLHIIPFRPMYRMTDVVPETLKRIDALSEIAGRYLKYIY